MSRTYEVLTGPRLLFARVVQESSQSVAKARTPSANLRL